MCGIQGREACVSKKITLQTWRFSPPVITESLDQYPEPRENLGFQIQEQVGPFCQDQFVLILGCFFVSQSELSHGQEHQIHSLT